MRQGILFPLALCACLPSCQAPDRITFGKKPDGSPRAQVWLNQEARREARAAASAAAQPGTPLPPAGPGRDVLEGPVTVGLRRDGACVVAGKAVPEEEIGMRLSFIRAERLKTGSADTSVVTVLTENQVPMDRVMHAMSCGHQSGFTKIGYQIVEGVPLPPPEPVAAALPADEGRLIVSVAADGGLKLGQEAVDAKGLAGKLQAAAAQRLEQSLPPPALTLLADHDAPLTAVKEVLGACDAAGITAVALGSPVQVASTQAPPPAQIPDISELYRNWRLGIENRDVDFKEGPPEYWYDALYHACLDEHEMLRQELGSRTLIRQRLAFFGEKLGKHLDQMAWLLAAVDAPRGETLKGLAGDYRRLTSEAAEGQANLETVRFRLVRLRTRITKEFPPETVTFPPGTKILPPQEKKP